jgi:leucyl/phenylalanyl-tRNA--protein transferase
MDHDFAATIRGCAERSDREETGTWITPRMQRAYMTLHHMGFAHSVEVIADGRLAGGLYGVSFGRLFFGESMFSYVTDASKVAFVALHIQLKRWGFALIDCQLPNPHLTSLGVTTMPRKQFLWIVEAEQHAEERIGRWQMDADWRDDLAALGSVPAT